MTGTSSTPSAPTSWTSITTRCKMYVGNYDFWYESSQLMQQIIRRTRTRTQRGKDQGAAELHPALLAPTNPNPGRPPPAKSCSKSSTVEEMPASSRRYPCVGFKPDREAGKDILDGGGTSPRPSTGSRCSTTGELRREQRGQDRLCRATMSRRQTALFRILMEELEPDEGSFKWGVTTSQAYFPKDNSAFFDGLRPQHCSSGCAQFSPDDHRDLSARLPRADALLGRRRLQARQGAVRRRKGALHALPHDAAPAPTSCCWTSPPTTSTWSRITAVNNGLADYPGQPALCLARPPVHRDDRQPDHRDPHGRHDHRPDGLLRRIPRVEGRAGLNPPQSRTQTPPGPPSAVPGVFARRKARARACAAPMGRRAVPPPRGGPLPRFARASPPRAPLSFVKKAAQRSVRRRAPSSKSPGVPPGTPGIFSPAAFLKRRAKGLSIEHGQRLRRGAAASLIKVLCQGFLSRKPYKKAVTLVRNF